MLCCKTFTCIIEVYGLVFFQTEKEKILFEFWSATCLQCRCFLLLLLWLQNCSAIMEVWFFCVHICALLVWQSVFSVLHAEIIKLERVFAFCAWILSRFWIVFSPCVFVRRWDPLATGQIHLHRIVTRHAVLLYFLDLPLKNNTMIIIPPSFLLLFFFSLIKKTIRVAKGSRERCSGAKWNETCKRETNSQ